MSGTLEGKKGLILGVANKRSVAWSCAQALSREGMSLALTYANPRLEKSVRQLAEELEVTHVPAFLQGVGAVPEMNLEDGLHPNARGHALLAANARDALTGLVPPSEPAAGE